MFNVHILAVLGLFWGRVLAHTVITYPGWRGDNLHTNGTLPQYDMNAKAIGYENGQYTFPYGQQWAYPCGGMPLTTNRSLWPVTGGSFAWQPGWFQGHVKAAFYLNIGINGPGDIGKMLQSHIVPEADVHLAPPNMSHNIVSEFHMDGPSNQAFNGTICLPEVTLPSNLSLKIGDNITIQLIEVAQHGASIYTCADVTLADPADVPAANLTTCFNTTTIGFQNIYTTAELSGAQSLLTTPSAIIIFVSTFIALATFGL